MMNNQQMKFGGPDYPSDYDPDPRYINADPREQPEQQVPADRSYETGYEDGYAGSYQQSLYGEKLRPRTTTPSRRRKNRWLYWLIPWAILLFFMGIYAMSSHSVDNFGKPSFNMHDFKHGPQFPSDYTVDSFLPGSTPTLVIQDNGGSVQIHSGNASTVTIQQTGFFSGDGDRQGAPLNIVRPRNDNNNTATVAVQDTGAPVDLDITVPQGINVQVEDNTGQVIIDGVNGTVNVTAGDSLVDVSNIQGNVTLHTNDGKINADNITGQVNISTQTGSITVQGSTLSGQSVIRTSDGSIDFQGSIDAQGSYDFETGTGSIDITLPANTSFRVIKDVGQGSYSNDFGNDTTGSTPNPPLTVKSTNGSVSIHRS